ncbi:MAG: hypothetical protein GY927_25415 [bacterium]|nr:hypothetical protein [bacterium]
MFEYRSTALLLPAFLLFALPTLAAFPWQIPFGQAIALPYLTLLTILFGSVRYPGLFLSPFVFISGLLCDLFTRSPLGFWALLFLLTLACARTTTLLTAQRGPLAVYLCMLVALIFMTAGIWGLSSLYQLALQDPRTTIKGLVMALLLLPVPVLFLVGLEKLFILKRYKIAPRSYRSQQR